MSRPAYRLELASTLCFAVPMAVVDGAIVGVYARQAFDGSVGSAHLNFMVALLAAAPEIANILSFIWTTRSQGRPKIPLINVLQFAVVVLIASLALLPQTPVGLTALVVLVLAARVCWSGIITLRPTVWRANYPRSVRARVVGKFSTIQVVVVAIAAGLLGALLDVDEGWYHWIVPMAALVGVLAVLVYRKVRVRREAALLRDERSGQEVMKPWEGLSVVGRVLRKDPFYARFMLWMFVMGIGNLMLTPVLIITLKERFGLANLASMLVVSILPLLATACAIPLWARFLDRAHVVRFRAIHGWTFVIGNAFFLAATLTGLEALLFAGAITMGIGFGGGALAWNLGHVDFAPPAQTSQYMATHVTLNGVRGLMAPFIAVGLYETFKAAGLDAPSLLLSLTLIVTIAGALGFVHLRRQMGAAVEHVQRSQ
jgi:MFS family permease